ncbi:MAG TPA: hypothetical protein DCY88_19640 [Cyanobacteria bacterium UBA11372]|nr:hypothetical protein [Cyanobacteria bacterium UBA11372]
MRSLRHRINPKTFVISLRQIAKLLKISQERILNWEKWHNVLWVHIEGVGGYFVSYRKLEQWIAACQTSIGSCRNLDALNELGHLILQEAQRYTQEALSRLEALWQKRYADLCSRQQKLKAE